MSFTDKKKLQSYLPLATLIASLLVTCFVWRLLVQKDQQAIKRITHLQASNMIQNLDQAFDPLIKVLGHMARRNSAEAYPTEKRWRNDAKSYYEEFPFLRRFFQTDSAGLIKWVYPLEFGGKEVIGTQIATRTPELRDDIDEMKQNMRFTISSIFPAATGETVFVFMAPSRVQNKYIGATGVAVYSDRFFEHTLELEGYDVRVIEEGKVVYKKGNPNPGYAKFWKQNKKFLRMGIHWQIELVPQSHLIRANSSVLPLTVLVMGIVFSILLALAIKFNLRTRNSEKIMKEVLDWKMASLNSTPLLFISLDENTVIRELNMAAEELLGYSAEELVGKVSPLIFHDLSEVREYQKRLEAEVGRNLSLGKDYMEAIFERGYHKSSEWILKSKSGQHYNMTISTSRIVNDEGVTTGYLQILEDVTAIRERERVLEEQERKLAISSRLASLGEMAAGIAHEINNPLAIISGHVSVLKKQSLAKNLQDSAEHKRLETMENVVQRIAKIIKGLRSYVREPTVEALETVTVVSLVDDALTYCKDNYERQGVELQIEIQPGLHVSVLPYQISQVILNLLNNALDAVKLTNTKQVQLNARTVDDGVEISVTDSGVGIPYTLKSKIMEPFFTTKEVGQGVGLGLSICQGLVQGHHGKFFLDDSSKKTRFVIWLP